MTRRALTSPAYVLRRTRWSLQPLDGGRITDVTTDPAAELVTILDDDGRPCGVATRGQVRRQNLLHGATAVLVRRSDGRVYVHRRTTTKDIYPGAFDCWAGGVLAVGEPPDVGAARELAEELGVEHAALRPLVVTRWSDPAVQAIYHVYSTEWDGPIVHQAAEVAWGEWWTLETLAGHLAMPDFPFVPDGRRLLEVIGLLATSSQRST
jgi:isopentenyldiphosphate isomerase